LTTKEMATVETNYVTLYDPEFMEAIKENLGDGGMSPLELPRIRVPSGGGEFWTISSIDGDKSVKSFKAVIAYWTTMRAYWEKPFDETGGGSPPQCSSQDGIVGLGNPGGSCASCPLNQFGSGKQNSKSCREVRANFLLMEGSKIPVVYMAPTMSVKPEKQYLMQLAAAGKVYSTVETVFTLETDKSATGIKYSKGITSLSRSLSDEEIHGVNQWKAVLKKAAQSISVSEQDV